MSRIDNVNKDTTYTVPVTQDKARDRLDRFLAGAVPALSRSRLKGLIESGRVTRDGAAVTEAAAKVKAGEVYAVFVPAAAPAAPRPQAIPLNVVYEDDDLIVIDKSPGLVVHPAAGHPDGTLVNALLAHCGSSLSGIGGGTRPGIVHRLDKDTSGLMVAAKNDTAHRHLAAQLEERKLERRYKALVWGRPRPGQGKVEGLIGRSPANRKKMAVVKKGGKPSLTRYRVLAAVGAAASLVECRLATGRTHQIRVHMASLGHPVVGDPLYGGGTKRRLKNAPETVRLKISNFNHQALHAFLIGFTHPSSGVIMQLKSELPSNFNELVDNLEKI
ncbi:MAG: RNA pseudouridine synthase [Rhodospirillaceae bacterium]|nr:RNA pseudouridine synthase [Rhodospirillaceae bacterium]